MGAIQSRWLTTLMLITATLRVAIADPLSMTNGVAPIPADASESQIKKTAGIVRAGRILTPKTWKGGARVAVCLSFDVDNEFHTAVNDARPVALSTGEYGATTGLPRLLAVLDRQKVPGSFFIPAGAIILHPEMIQRILKSGRHEIGVHGWVHEYIPELSSAAQEEQLLSQSIAYLTKAIGTRPVGYRAPDWDFGPDTLDQIHRAGFLYDSSMMAMDQPYELISRGTNIDMIELPVSWVLDDFIYFGLHADGSLPDPAAVFRIFRSEFDEAYKERTLFVLTMHPAVSGIRSRAVELARLIAYMKEKPGVWFATMQDVARYIQDDERAGHQK